MVYFIATSVNEFFRDLTKAIVIMYKLDLAQLEVLNNLISENEVFKHKVIIKKGKQGKCRYYQIYNQLCACIVRIRETCQYLIQFNFKKENVCGQAFDFYEFVNCISIILGCIENLFGVFNVQCSDNYKTKKIFYKSNKTKQSDVNFFKFIRSASAVHPSETTKYNKITKLKFEVYPYALWADKCADFFLEDVPKDYDIDLVGWNCKAKCLNNHYYLYISEFYDFVNELLIGLKSLLPTVQKIVEDNREKERFKVVKSPVEFNNYSDYLVYLRKRLLQKNKSEEFADGGLLLAAHIFDSKIIGNEFKAYIKIRVQKLVATMKRDIGEISYNNIFNDLSLYELIKNWKIEKSSYISDKFDIYLRRQALWEIENKQYDNICNSFKRYKNNTNYSDAEWSVNLLMRIWDRLYVDVKISEANSFTDIYELTLEEIYLQTRANK